MSFSLASKHEQKQKSDKKDTKWNRARVHMRCKDIMHNAHSFSLSLLDNNTDQISSQVEFLMPFIFQYLYFYTTYDILQNQAKMFNYQSQFLTFIQFSSKILGIFSQKLVLVANGWHLWLSTTLIGIQEKCHRTTCVPSCLKL